jgi:hypothetical protein
MRIRVRLWIVHSKAIVVTVTDKGEQIDLRGELFIGPDLGEAEES